MPTDAPDDPLLDARVLIAGQIALTIADLVDRGRLTAEQADRLVREGASLLAK